MLTTLPSPVVAQGRSGTLTHVRVTIAGVNDDWTSTTLTVAPGDLLLLSADGRVRVGQFMGEVGPDGAPTGEGVVELKIGVNPGQRVGGKAFLIADQAGEVKLRVHDSRYDDNAGSFQVSVILIPPAAVPSPKLVGSAGQPVVAEPSTTEGQAAVAEVKSDLRNLVTAQEVFFGDSTRYTGNLRRLQFTPSPGVRIVSLSVTGAAYTATATHTSLPGYVCAIFVGDVQPPVGAQREGEPVCFLR
jgi:hypothetical protein